MRYQNWDVLLFPDLCKIPLQEFKTSCQVIQDPETHNFQTNSHLLPTVTCFIPGLTAGAPFRISIHCWQNPEISRYLQSFKKPSDNVMFEARLFVDGRIVGSKWFHQAGPWPAVIDLSIDLDKHGDFEKLRFPNFHNELLSQSYWNASDDLGRIKLVLAEGFARDNFSYPFDRIKSIASFSFQHAPLEVLEASSIAWPNAAMWRQASLVGPYMAQQQSPQPVNDGIETHSHSPRRESTTARPQLPARGPGFMLPPSNIFPRQLALDPFTDQVHAAFTGWRHASSADIFMPDYSSSSSNTRANSSRQVTDPMSISGMQDRRLESMGMPDSHFESLCEALMPSAPDNTPQNEENTPITITVTRKASGNASKERLTIKRDIEKSESVPAVTHGAAIISNVKSRKANIQSSPLGARSSSASKEDATRKVSQTFITASNSGNKRQRIITPAASKAIDDEDEPRSSPSTRKVSWVSLKQDGQGQRRVLSNLTNV